MSEEQSKWKQLGDAVRELEVITALFSWLFNLLSRLAEPLMTLAVIYTIIVSGLPQTMVPALYNVALAVMIGAPEVILPGAFIMAGQQQQGGNKRAWMLFGVCILFVLLTSLTLADLLIFHFDETGTSILMCVRCVTGVSYSILVRIVSYEHGLDHLRSSQAFDPQAFMNQALNQVSQINQQLVQDIHLSQEQFMNQIINRSQETMKQAVTQIEQVSRHCLEQIEQQHNAIQAKSNGAQLHSVAHTRDKGTHARQSSKPSAAPNKAESENTEFHKSTEVRGGSQMFTVHGESELEDDEVYKSPDIQEEARVHVLEKVAGGERVNREQVCSFILNYWREHNVMPTIKFIRDNTGCSQGLASECRKLVTQDANT